MFSINVNLQQTLKWRMNKKNLQCVSSCFCHATSKADSLLSIFFVFLLKPDTTMITCSILTCGLSERFTCCSRQQRARLQRGKRVSMVVVSGANESGRGIATTCHLSPVIRHESSQTFEGSQHCKKKRKQTEKKPQNKTLLPGKTHTEACQESLLNQCAVCVCT